MMSGKATYPDGHVYGGQVAEGDFEWNEAARMNLMVHGKAIVLTPEWMAKCHNIHAILDLT